AASRLSGGANGVEHFRSVVQGVVRESLAVTGPIRLGGGRRVVALVGATGVGKTTTLAKLAANYRLRDGARVGLVTVDTYRTAAVEQLRTYAEIIDLPMEVVSTPEEMRRAVTKLAALDLVLIDTAGRSPRDGDRLQVCSDLLDAASPDETHLVTTVTGTARGMRDALERFAPVRPTSLLLTKLDEAPSLGHAAAPVLDSGLPVSYLTDGQSVPEDIRLADAKSLAGRLLGEEANHLRRVAEGMAPGMPPTAERVVVVLGAKGGVGASAVALTTARDLARSTSQPEGVAVLAIDAHAGRNDLAVMAAADETPTAGLVITTAAKLGVAPAPGEGAYVGEAAKRLLRAARQWTEDAGGWIVIDAGVGDTLWARELASRAARPLLIVGGDRLSTVNGYLTLKRLGAVAARVGVIVNHCPNEEAARGVHRSLSESCQKFLAAAPMLAGWLPTTIEDPANAPVTAAFAA
ncbi:flhF, partial [Symbiodinium sp. CCMP2456]